MRVFLLMWLLVSRLFGGPVLEIVNKEGQSLEGEILNISDEVVKVRRTSDQKIFDLKLASLSEGTIGILERKKEEIGPTHPEYEFDVSVLKRRKRDTRTYYEFDMELGGKVTIKNKDRVLDCPGCKMRMIFVGQKQGDSRVHEILNVQNFEMAPKAAQTQEFELKSFFVKYDNYKGSYGFLGGYELAGYVLLVTDKKGGLIYTKTLNKKFEKSLQTEPNLAANLMKVKKGKELNEKLLPL